METLIIKAEEQNTEQAAEVLKNGGIVAVPTETVYGLAANALDVSAVRSIFAAKGRPQDNPLILHISSIDMLYDIAAEILPLALILAENFWPGPLTMIFPRKEAVPAETCGGLDTAAVRMPNNAYTLSLIEKCGFPLAAPSANTSGLPSPTSAQHVYDDMKGKIPLIADGGECRFGVESTVISFDGSDSVRILRPGAVTAEMLREYAHVAVDSGVLRRIEPEQKVLSPGMKYKHYSPKADVFIIDGDDEQVGIFIDNVRANGNAALLGSGREKLPNGWVHLPYGDTSEEQAEHIFSSLRKADELNCGAVYVRMPDTSGIGLAVYNRLLRSAAFRVINLGEWVKNNVI